MEKLILWYEISVKANAWARERKAEDLRPELR